MIVFEIKREKWLKRFDRPLFGGPGSDFPGFFG